MDPNKIRIHIFLTDEVMSHRNRYLNVLGVAFLQKDITRMNINATGVLF